MNSRSNPEILPLTEVRESKRLQARRKFLGFLAASPLLKMGSAFAQQFHLPEPLTLDKAEDALSVFDFEAIAYKKLPPAHFGYMTSGVDSDGTNLANREGFKHFQLHPRRLVDVSKTDLHVDILGANFDAPIFLSPLGGQRMFHNDGELGTARAAKAKNTLQILSTVSSTSVEDVAVARGMPTWFQLYLQGKWEDTEKLVRRADAAGCPTLVITVDLLGGRNTETATRFRRMDTRNCVACHTDGVGSTKSRAMFKGLDGGRGDAGATATWELVDRVRKWSKMKVVIKGIETGEDAQLAHERGVDLIILSNHGGRATDTGRGTIECLPEVLQGAGSTPVMIDGGFRRGTDIYKALALGARAVGIGRPYTWGLTAFGQEGVERVLDILRAELTMTMRQCGTPTLASINKNYVREAKY